MDILEHQRQELHELKQISRILNVEIQSCAHLSSDLVMNESILQQYTEMIRSKWLQKASTKAASYNRAPWKGQIPQSVGGEPVAFSYETLLDDSYVAQRFENRCIFRERSSKTVLYNSGMAAIRGTIDLIDIFTKAALKIVRSVGYFETKVYIESLINRGVQFFNLGEHIDPMANVFIFEPICYNMNLDITDIELMIKAINSSQAHAIFVVMDTTMHNCTNLLAYMEKRLVRAENVIFIELRSGVKLDQLGLEIENLGIASWYVHKCNASYADVLFNYINYYKGIIGDNISFSSLISLEFFSSQTSFEYANKVQSIVADFVDAISVQSTDFVRRIISPTATYGDDKIKMPFVFMKLNSEERRDYEQFVENLVCLCKTYGFFLPYRNSFGFRYPSIEYICDYKTKECVVKLSLGCYKGALFFLLQKIFQDLSHPDSSDIKEKMSKGIDLQGNV